jgi:hypothetical protein
VAPSAAVLDADDAPTAGPAGTDMAINAATATATREDANIHRGEQESRMSAII